MSYLLTKLTNSGHYSFDFNPHTFNVIICICLYWVLVNVMNWLRARFDCSFGFELPSAPCYLVSELTSPFGVSESCAKFSLAPKLYSLLPSSVYLEPAAARVGSAMFDFTRSPVSEVLEFTF